MVNKRKEESESMFHLELLAYLLKTWHICIQKKILSMLKLTLTLYQIMIQELTEKECSMVFASLILTISSNSWCWKFAIRGKAFRKIQVLKPKIYLQEVWIRSSMPQPRLMEPD